MKLDHHKITPSRIISGLLRIWLVADPIFMGNSRDVQNEEAFKTVRTLRVAVIPDNSGIGCFNPPNLAC